MISITSTLLSLISKLSPSRAANLDEITPTRMAKVDVLDSRLTSTRSGYLDEINSTRMPKIDSIDSAATPMLSEIETILGRVPADFNSLVSTVGTNTSTFDSRLTAERAVLLAKLGQADIPLSHLQQKGPQNIEVIDTSITGWAFPTGVEVVYVTAIGGGGQGYRGDSYSSNAGPGGGAGGMVTRIPVYFGSSLDITIGAGGYEYGAQQDGGDTIVSVNADNPDFAFNIICTGGSYIYAGSSNFSNLVSGTTNGFLATRDQYNSSIGGVGGSTPFGKGGLGGTYANWNPTGGTGYGSGGGGGGYRFSSTGGAGAPGVVILEY